MGDEAAARKMPTPADGDSSASRPAQRKAPAPFPQGRGPDRRKKPTNPFSFRSLFHGRRKAIRRSTDRQTHYYVDRYGPTSLALFLLSLAFSTLDAFITLHLIEAGGRELNPVMLFALQIGEIPFLAVKFALTLAGLLFLLIHKEYHLFGWRIRGKHMMAFALALYAALIVWEFSLLRKL